MFAQVVRRLVLNALFSSERIVVTSVSVSHPVIYLNCNSHAIAGRTARYRCKFRYVSNFTTASCSFSATPRLSCVGLHQRLFKCWDYTRYTDFHGRDTKSRRPDSSRGTPSNICIYLIFPENGMPTYCRW